MVEERKPYDPIKAINDHYRRTSIMLAVMIFGVWVIFATGLILRSMGILPLWTIPQ